MRHLSLNALIGGFIIVLVLLVAIIAVAWTPL
jgi:hypothetical protein